MADTIESQLEQDAIAGVQSVTADGVSVTQMSVDDRIKAAQFAAKQRSATAGNPFGWAIRKLVPTRSQAE